MKDELEHFPGVKEQSFYQGPERRNMEVGMYIVPEPNESRVGEGVTVKCRTGARARA